MRRLVTKETAYKLDWERCRRVAKTVCYEAGINWEDKEDFVSDVLVEMMERAGRDSGGLTSEEMWRAARCVRSRYWRTYKKARRNSSLPLKISTICSTAPCDEPRSTGMPPMILNTKDMGQKNHSFLIMICPVRLMIQ